MSTVIKAGQTGPILGRLSTVDLADHLAQADAVVQEARRQAAEIVAAARRQKDEALDQARRAGYEAGKQEGYRAGAEAGRAQAYDDTTQRFDEQQSSLVESMRKTIADVEAMKDSLRIAAERDVLEFAIGIASKLTFAIGRTHHESAQENFRRALALVGSQTNLAVHVHPDDLASMETFAPSVVSDLQAGGSVSVKADAGVAPGGCRVQNDRTDIDATLDTQVKEMVALLLGERDDAKGDHG